jgi:hypothetical protein
VVVAVLNKFSSWQAGLVSRKEVLVVAGSKKRMDICLYGAAEEKWADVSIITPTGPSYVKQAAKTRGSAAEAREKQKQAKWGNEATSRNKFFFPVVFESTGLVGPSAARFIRFLCESTVENSNKFLGSTSARNRFLDQLGREIVSSVAVALAHANHLIIEEVRIRLANPSYINTGPLYRGIRSRYGS